MEPYVLENGVEKSVSDDRHYRAITLPNGLRALLVSDAEADKSAAAVCVHVGSLSDPVEIPGLAHFLEHMLFLGTEKYPDENSFSAFLSAHGGDSNAMTGDEHTTYYFDVANAAFPEALDRFAQFFVAPLFTEGATDRELNAVDSEHSKNLQSDTWRLHEVTRATSRPDHPYSKFGTGNLKTLKEDVAAQGLDLRAALLRFYEQHYSASVMAAVVLGQESLDELQRMVEERFAGVVRRDVEPPVCPPEPWGPEQLRLRVSAVPVKELRSVQLYFQLPSMQPHYASKPGHYFGHLVGHEGPGSLLSYLKARGWATDLMAGVLESTSGFALFGVDVRVTEQGFEQARDVVLAVFQYLAMLRAQGAQHWVFEEVAAMDACQFRFMNKRSPTHTAMELAGDMLLYPAQKVLTAPHLLTEYNEALLNDVLGRLVPSNCRVVLVSRAVHGKTDQVEPWYGTEYAVEHMEEHELALLLSPPANPELRLPTPNSFIPTDFSLRHADDAGSEREAAAPAHVAHAAPTAPALVRDSPSQRVWFKQDRKYLRPKLALMMALRLPEAYTTPTAALCCELLCRVVKDALNEYAYLAEVAGLRYSLNFTVTGLTLSLNGFNHKLPVLLRQVAHHMVACEVTAELFERQLDQVRRELENRALQQPYVAAMDMFTEANQIPYFSAQQKLAALPLVTLGRLREFQHQVFSLYRIDALVMGNATQAEALALVDTVEAALASTGARAAQPEVLPLPRHVQAPLGVSALQTRNLNPEQENAALLLTLQLGERTTTTGALAQLLASMLHEPLFDQLRTKQQLGYLVWSNVQESDGRMQLSVVVQSAVADTAHLLVQTEAFLRGYMNVLREMTEEEFQQHVQAAVTRMTEQPKNLNAEAGQAWGSILSQTLRFHARFVEAECLTSLSQQDVAAFFEDLVAPGAANRRAVVCRVEASKPRADLRTAAPEELAGVREVASAAAFRLRNPLLPSLTGPPSARL